MGEINNLMYEYLGLAKYCCDFWNGTLYGGKRKIKVWQLERYRKGIFTSGRPVQMFCQRKKDVILVVDCLESARDNIHKSILKRRSGQIPIRTALLYCGEEDYDGMAELAVLFRDSDVRGNLQRFLQECRIGVFQLQFLKEENYETSFREIVGAFKRRNNQAELVKYYMENQQRFREFDEISIELLGALIDVKGLKKYKQDKGGVDMCKAFAQATENGRRKGIEEGKRQGRREGYFQALCFLVKKGKLELKDAAEEVGMSEEMFLESMKDAMCGI